MEFQARRDVIQIRQSAEFELTGDDRLETVTVTATGDGWVSLLVRIDIRAADGSSLYSDEWESVRYFNQPPGWQRLSVAERERVVRGAMSALVGDQRALQADMLKRGHQISAEQEMRDAVEWDLRQARQTPSQERVNALLQELRDQPKFIYFSGNESHTGIAWSPREARFVRVYLCC